MDQSELRDLLHDKADDFSPTDHISTEIKRRAKRRLVFSAIRSGLAMTVLLASGVLLIGQLGQEPASTELTSVPLAIDLVDYSGDRHQQRDGGDAHVASRDDVLHHVACIREQGFDLPAPTRTERGWSVLVEDPRALGLEGRAWREAAFVTCRPAPPPGPGDLIFGAEMLTENDIESFRSCMAAEGFALPAPVRSRANEWRLDTSSGNFDFGSDALHRAVFVTCWPGAAH